MALTHNQDYVYYESGLMMNSKQPMKNVDVCVVSTKDYVFYVPKKSVGMFVIVNTITTHQYFDGVSIEQGVQTVIKNAESVADLEKSMIALLEDDEKYVHKIADKKSFKFKGFLGKHTLRMSTGGANWSSVMANGKGNSKEFRAFHGQ
jgi:methyl coenzyme M reductase beta subunit